MDNMLVVGREICSKGLLIGGTLILLATFLVVHRIASQIPRGGARRSWSVLRWVILLLIATYGGYTAATWYGLPLDAANLSAYIMPLTYFLCACVVYLVVSFVKDTAAYIKQYATGELQNIIDPVFGVYNRHYLDSRLVQEVKRAVRYKLPLSVLLVCIDSSSKIAEQYGKDIAVDIMSRFGRLLLSTARSTDVVACFSGDKVMIIATNTPVTSTPVYADRLRKVVTENITLPKQEVDEYSKGTLVTQVTICIGIAGIGPDITKAEELISSAEDALGQAQAKGPNMAIVNSAFG